MLTRAASESSCLGAYRQWIGASEQGRAANSAICCLLMRGLRFHVDHDHRAGPDFPALRLFAEVMLDAVALVRGVRHANATLPARSADAAAARAWIRDGNVGVLSFNDCCGYLGMDAEHVRRAIFRAVPSATRDAP